MSNIVLPDDTSGKAFKTLAAVVKQLADKYNNHTHGSAVNKVSGTSEAQTSGSSAAPMIFKI